MTDALVIGAGPAGLMAAETLAANGVSVTIVDAMPSVGRKFLMAGKSGLNLTKNEDADAFQAAFGPLPAAMQAALADFGPAQVMAWAEGLGQPLFTGSTGRVFPKAMKASPLLRAWMARLDGQGVTLKTRWLWVGWDAQTPIFDTPEGRVTRTAPIVVLALGGASWARLGSNGDWAAYLPEAVTAFAPANMGFGVAWSAHIDAHLGKPIKSIKLSAGTAESRGEIVLTKAGIEGGGIYMVSRAMREGAALTVDLLPDWDLARVRAALRKPQGKTSLTNHLRKTLKLGPAQIALLSEFGRPFPNDLAPLIKALPINHTGPHPMDQAISTAGGVRFDALDGFVLKEREGVFCAGEMLDWEAPTGGYLITACLAAGRAAALQALTRTVAPQA
ncbi:MAG: TIGR03862 family flavoprotein [Yoonia sp.]|nr:TIGR03862 family flavoprotein [Yoonia sp.]